MISSTAPAPPSTIAPMPDAAAASKRAHAGAASHDQQLHPWTFVAHEPTQSFSCLRDRELCDSIAKWGLGPDHAYLRKFSYDPYVPEYRLHDFVQAFLQDPGVQQTLQVLQPNDTWRPMGPIDETSLRFRPLRTTVVDMTLFDLLFTTGIVRPNGAITKCFDEYVSPDTITPIDDAETAATWTDPGDFVVSDELQRVLVDPTSERYSAFSTAARQELLFVLLEHMVLGGRVNQFEDELAPYLHAVRTLYKDLVSPCKLPDGTLAVQGMAVQVMQHESRAGGTALFPMRHRQNFLLVVVDPVRRHVSVWYHASPNYYQ